MSFLRIIIGIIIGTFLMASIVLYYSQEKMIFITDKSYNENIILNSDNIEEINVIAKDGTKLHGVFINNNTDKILFYYGGNAGDSTALVYNFIEYSDWSIVLMNYRGYGLSEGKPSEKKLFSDAIEIYDYFTKEKQYSKILAMGRSLGTAIATFMVVNRKFDAIILVSPFDSLTNIGKSQYPYLPISLILKHKFESIKLAPKINIPLFMLIALNDTLVSPESSKRLAKKWGSKVEIKEIANEDHDSILISLEYWNFITYVLNKLSEETI